MRQKASIRVFQRLPAFPHTHGMRDKVQEGKYLAVPAVLKVLSTARYGGSGPTKVIVIGSSFLPSLQYKVYTSN